jgi:hypothetical protein
MISRNENRRQCPIQLCKGKLVQIEDKDPTDLGQYEFFCAKCRKTYLGMSAESISKNVRFSERELSQWKVRVVSAHYKGFEKLKLSKAEQAKVEGIRAGRIFYG